MINVLLLNPAPSIIKYGIKCGFEQNGCNTFLPEEIVFMQRNNDKINAIKNCIDNYKIDLLFCEYYSNIPLHDIKKLCEKNNVQVHFWAIEDPVSPHIGNYVCENKLSDFIWTTTKEFIPKYIQMGLDSDLLLFGCNPDIQPVESDRKFEHDISIVGTNYSNRYDKVGQFLFPLIGQNFDLKVYGQWWLDKNRPINLCKHPRFHWSKKGYNALPYEWLPKVVNSSKIMFGLNCSDESETQTSCRPYETLACSKNSVYLSWYTKAQENIFGKYIYQAKTGQEMISMARDILAMTNGQRQDIAARARDYVIKNHSYKLRAKQVIDKFFEIKERSGV